MPDPVAPPVAGLVLAAGAGRRFGRPKALVRQGDRLFVELAAAVLQDGGCAPVVVVLGALADQVRAAATLPGVSLVDNPEWPTGMASSLRAGLRSLADTGANAALILPVDTPGVTSAAIRRFTALSAPDVLARATYHGEPGHPVLIGRGHWEQVVEQATGDAGARSYLQRHKVLDIPCEDIANGSDIDHPEDLR